MIYNAFIDKLLLESLLHGFLDKMLLFVVLLTVHNLCDVNAAAADEVCNKSPYFTFSVVVI